MTAAAAVKNDARPARIRLRPLILLRAIGKHIWATRGHLIRRRTPWAVAILIGLLVVRQFFAIGVIWSPSVDPSLVVVRKGSPAVIGRLAAYRYPGRVLGDYRPGDDMVHWVIAGEGSVITVVEKTVFVDGQPVGMAKEETYRREKLTPIEARLVPKDHYYVMGTHVGALDSRYAEAGLIHKGDVIGSAWVLF